MRKAGWEEPRSIPAAGASVPSSILSSGCCRELSHNLGVSEMFLVLSAPRLFPGREGIPSLSRLAAPAGFVVTACTL